MYLSLHPWHSISYVTPCALHGPLPACLQTRHSSLPAPLPLGSADVKALYPSLDIDFTIEKVCDIFFESDVRGEGVDYEEVGLYLAINIDPEVLQRSNIADVRPTRKSKCGRKPSGREEKKEEPFKPPKKQVDERAKRLMLREVVLSNAQTCGFVSDHEEPCIHIQQRDQVTNKRRTNRPEIDRSLDTNIHDLVGPRIYMQA